jgi:hypothetical protein
MIASLDQIHHATGTLVDVMLAIGAVAAAIKFRLYNILGRRWRTDVSCTHFDLQDGSTLFAADYYIQNTGRRPIHVNGVSLVVAPARDIGGLLEPTDTTIVRRDMQAGDRPLAGLFQVEPGERSIFTIRARLESLPEFMFVTGTFSMPGSRSPAAFRSLYVRAARREALPAGARSEGESLSEP